MTVGSNPRGAATHLAQTPAMAMAVGPCSWFHSHSHSFLRARATCCSGCIWIPQVRFHSLPSPIPEPLPDVILAAIAGAWRQPRVCVPVGFAPPSLPGERFLPFRLFGCRRHVNLVVIGAHSVWSCGWFSVSLFVVVSGHGFLSSWWFHVFLAMPPSGFSAGLLCTVKGLLLSGMATVLMVLLWVWKGNRGFEFLFGLCSCLAMAFWILNGLCLLLCALTFFWGGHTVSQCYLDWPWYGWFCFRGLNVVPFERKSRMVLGGYGGGHGRVLISCMGLHVGRRLCSCLAQAFWILDSLSCLLLLAWLLCAVNSLFPLGCTWCVSSLEGKPRIWRFGRCFNPRRT
jgi:hypothetical protein